jgi:4-hydroxy-3-polyprenylbenzoate decarboxylase
MSRPNLFCSLAYDDLRGWIAEADRLGELRTIRGASWEEDIGDAAEAVIKADEGPAVLFDEVKGCHKGYRLLINVFAGKRRNMTLGFPDDLTKAELSDAVYESHVKDRKTIPFKIVDGGPILENVLTGDDIDLLKFPTPIWHAQDGGRYIGTGTYSVTRDPDDGWINVGTYRSMVHDKRSVGVLMVPGKHGHVHREKHFKKGEKFPIVMVFGGDPVTFYAASTEAPNGVCEFDLVGGMRGHPVECVKGRVTSLPFPANCEIAIEGYLRPGHIKTEGPFGEWTGYYASGEHPEPVLEVEALYHRNDPIILGVPPMGGGSDEMGRYRAILRSAMLKEGLRAAGVPDVANVWCHEVGSSRMLHGVAIRQRYPGHAKQAGHIAAQCHATNYANKYVVVVDDDIDVTDLEELWWAMITRSDPATSIDLVHGARTSPADPRLTPEQRERGDLTNSRVVIDACRPFHWRDQFPMVNAPTAEQARKAREKFGHLLRGGAAKP